MNNLDTVKNDLVPVFTTNIGGELVKACDARALHTYLQNGYLFANWIKDRIEKYEFQENQDFILIFQNPKIKTGRGGDRRSKDYHLTLDMAKEVAMVESNAKGKEVRRYFIAKEKEANKSHLPSFVQRYIENRDSIPDDHFSMLNEVFLLLLAPLEKAGYILPDKYLPDGSAGRMFSDFLRDKGIDVDSMPKYTHRFPDGRIVKDARLYPIEFLLEFRNYFKQVWLPNRAIKYFAERDMTALPYLSSGLKLQNQSKQPTLSLF